MFEPKSKEYFELEAIAQLKARGITGPGAIKVAKMLVKAEWDRIDALNALGEFLFPETNSMVDDRERRKDLRCSICKPNKGENAKRRGKHGKTKPKYKDRK